VFSTPSPSSDDAGWDTEDVWVQTDNGTRIVIEDDTRRTFVRVTNTSTGADVVCANSGFPQNTWPIAYLRPAEGATWNGQSARYAIHCSSIQGVRLRVDEYTVPADNNPADDEDNNVYVVDPTPEPEPTPTPPLVQVTPPGGWQPSDPVYSPTPTTPTPTPAPDTNSDAYPGDLTDQATPTPSPTPVEIVED
jgi:hypothetical protein